MWPKQDKLPGQWGKPESWWLCFHPPSFCWEPQSHTLCCVTMGEMQPGKGEILSVMISSCVISVYSITMHNCVADSFPLCYYKLWKGWPLLGALFPAPTAELVPEEPPVNPQCRMSVCVLYWAHMWYQGNTRSGVSGQASGESGSAAEACCAGEDVLKVGLHFRMACEHDILVRQRTNPVWFEQSSEGGEWGEPRRFPLKVCWSLPHQLPLFSWKYRERPLNHPWLACPVTVPSPLHCSHWAYAKISTQPVESCCQDMGEFPKQARRWEFMVRWLFTAQVSKRPSLSWKSADMPFLQFGEKFMSAVW